MENAPEMTCYRHPNVSTRIRCQRCERPIGPECMTAGAVGYQCPECVTTGRKETRQGQLPYGGTASRDPRLTTIVLIAINAIVWLACLLGGDTIVNLLGLNPGGGCVIDGYVYPDASTAECSNSGGSFLHAVSNGAWWQLLTSGFTHQQVWHVAVNMYSLWILGPQIERLLGRWKFLGIYLVSLLTGSAAVMWLGSQYSTTVGASGAIFGLLGAFLLVILKHKGNVQSILAVLGMNVVITVMGASFISWQGHLGGFVGGLLATAAVLYVPKKSRPTMQWVLIVALGVIAVLVSVARGLQLA